MFESLATEVEELSIPPCREALIEVLAIRDRLDAKISDAWATSIAPVCGISTPPPP